MAKRAVREKDVTELLLAAGFKEVTETDKTAVWYKKATKQPSCLKAASGTKVKK